MSELERLLPAILPTSPPPTQPPPLPRQLEPPPRDVPELADAGAAGDLMRIQQYFSALADESGKVARDVDDRYHHVLETAFRQSQPEIANYLLGIGFYRRPHYVNLAAEARFTALLEVLITHGWDMNAPLTENTPPFLA